MKSPLDASKPYICSYDHLMKIKRLVTDVTSIGALSEQKVDLFGLFWTIFGQLRPLLWLESHFVIWKYPF